MLVGVLSGFGVGLLLLPFANLVAAHYSMEQGVKFLGGSNIFGGSTFLGVQKGEI
jgi:hypothetical protein